MASLGRDDRPPTAAEWEAFQTGHYAGFNDWLQQVADHRGLSFAEMETRAYGRVFTGREAPGPGPHRQPGQPGPRPSPRRCSWPRPTSTADQSPRVVHLPEPQGLLQQVLGDAPGPADPVTLAPALASVQRSSGRGPAHPAIAGHRRGAGSGAALSQADHRHHGQGPSPGGRPLPLGAPAWVMSRLDHPIIIPRHGGEKSVSIRTYTLIYTASKIRTGVPSCPSIES